MSVLEPWNLEEMEAFQLGLEGLLHHSSAYWPAAQEEAWAVPELSPLVDISEGKNEYLIKAELPGVRKADVKVTAEDGMLTITGERKFEREENGKRYHCVERAYGSFGRTFSLPGDVSPHNVSAEFKDGVLTVHLPKDEKTNFLANRGQGFLNRTKNSVTRNGEKQVE